MPWCERMLEVDIGARHGGQARKDWEDIASPPYYSPNHRPLKRLIFLFHSAHSDEDLSERPVYPYMNMRVKPFPWGMQSLFFNVSLAGK